ncbi:hypothetical protein [Lichenicola sp.]|uniref:hypothetical protein n=1 Tax=Lichenicola sp. TaxID=2804529 RepID=UPI003AFFD6B1
MFLTQAAMAVAALVVWRLATPSLDGLSKPARCLLLFVLLAMLFQRLIRHPLMDAVVTTAWSYSFLANLPALVPFLVIACLVGWTTPRPLRPWQLIVSGLAIAVLAFPVGGMLAAWLSRPLLASAGDLAHAAVYTMPYGMHVLVPAYVTALEPATATVALAGLVWDRLPGGTYARIAGFSVLVMVLDLHLLQPLVVLATEGPDRGSALVGIGQSWLATLVQSMLGAATWAFSVAGSRPLHRPVRQSG